MRLTKNHIIVVFTMLLTSCGGSSGASLGNLKFDSSTPPPQTSTTIGSTKVIDGYISGANVYVDMNYNFMQDAEEPSALYDNETNSYYWETSQFSNIETYDASCFYNRPKIAEVPVGAYDEDRGYVEEAYDLYFIPFDDRSANVTPFTTIIASYLNDIATTEMTVSEGCGQQGEAVEEDMKFRFNSLIGELQNKFDVDITYFYEDYIESGDTTKQAIAERLVDFMQTGFDVLATIENQYNTTLRIQIDEVIVDYIMNNTQFDSLAINVIGTEKVEDADDFIREEIFRVQDLVVDTNGNLIDSDGDLYTATFENIQTYANFQTSTTYLSKSNIVNNNPVMIEKVIDDNYTTYIVVFLGDNRQSYTESTEDVVGRFYSNFSATQRFDIFFRNDSNLNFDHDLENLFEFRDTTTFQNIYDDLVSFETTMQSIDINSTYLYSNDYQRIYNNQWEYLLTISSQECTDRTTSQIYYGTEAYDMCVQYLD